MIKSRRIGFRSWTAYCDKTGRGAVGRTQAEAEAKALCMVLTFRLTDVTNAALGLCNAADIVWNDAATAGDDDAMLSEYLDLEIARRILMDRIEQGE